MLNPIAPPSSSASAGHNLFSGFTRLCKGLSLVLISGYVLLQIFPSAVIYLALIPARTIPFSWNLLTAGYVEQSLHGVIISTIGLLFIGKFIEPIWGSKELMKFILIVNFLTSLCMFVTAVAFYYVAREESYLYTPVSGFLGVLAGLLVGIKQIMPDQEVGLFFLLKMKAKWLPSLLVFVSAALSFFMVEAFSFLPSIIFGTYMGWIYLRYLQRKPEGNLKGDPSDDFAFSTFFPKFLRPILDPIASIFHALLCGNSEGSAETKGYTVGGAPLPGSDPIEASRRRERGARALEERLAAEKSSTAESAAGASHGDVENV